MQAPAVYNKSENEIRLSVYVEEISNIDELSKTVTLKVGQL